MEKNLVTLIKEYITPEYITSLGDETKESEHSLNKAFDVSIPALLMGIFGKDTHQLSQLLQHVRSFFDSEESDDTSKIIGMSAATQMILGAHQGDTIRAVSEHSGISTSSAQTVLQTAALSIFGYLQNIAPNFDVATIQQFISANKSSLAALLPTGISLTGLTNWFTQSSTQPVSNFQNERVAEKDKSGNNILKMLIPLIILIALIVFLYRSCGNENNDAITDPESQDSLPRTEAQANPTAPVTSVRETLKVELPDGHVLEAFKGGIEDQLVSFLKKGDYKNMSEAQLKDTWFDFDHLNFETNSSKITADTEIQVQNIAAILTAFPDVSVKIGGYTDKTGNEENNIKLSTDRAKAVATELEKLLGKKDQINGAEGYGSQFAKYETNAPDSERALDRRVSLSVRNK